MSASVTFRSMYLCYRGRDARDDPRPVIESNERKIFFKYANKNKPAGFSGGGVLLGIEREREGGGTSSGGRSTAAYARQCLARGGGGGKKERKNIRRLSLVHLANDLSKR